MSCSEIVNGFFKASPKASQLPKIENEFKFIKEWREEHLYDGTYDPTLEVDDGATLAPNSFRNDDTIFNKDSSGRVWTMKYDKNRGLFFKRFLDHTHTDYVEFEAKLLTVMTKKTLIELPNGHQITIVIPETKDEYAAELMVQIKRMLSLVPKERITKFEFLSLSPGHYLHEYKVPATATLNEITFYKRSGDYIMASNFQLTDDLIRHEYGHILAIEVYGKHAPDEAWLEAIKRDRASVSKYGDTATWEDFAETVELYLRLEAENNLKDKRWQKYKYRFAELDQIFHNDRELHYRVTRIVQMKKNFPIRVLAIGGAGGAAYYFWDTQEGKISPAH